MRHVLRRFKHPYMNGGLPESRPYGFQMRKRCKPFRTPSQISAPQPRHCHLFQSHEKVLHQASAYGKMDVMDLCAGLRSGW